eukprot:4144176-Prorocentrum_lima.AAC.1
MPALSNKPPQPLLLGCRHDEVLHARRATSASKSPVLFAPNSISRARSTAIGCPAHATRTIALHSA